MMLLDWVIVILAFALGVFVGWLLFDTEGPNDPH